MALTDNLNENFAVTIVLHALQRLGHWPTVNNSIAQCVLFKSSSFGPLSKAKGFAIIRYEKIVTAITGLLRLISPLTVFRIVRTAIVLAFYRHASWRFAHIGKKVFKFAPAFTDCDAPATVEFIATAVSIKAPLNDTAPDCVGPRAGHSMGAARLDSSLNVQTATTLSFPAAQMITDHFGKISAIASAPPYCLAAPSSDMADCNESIKSLACDVFKHDLVIAEILCH